MDPDGDLDGDPHGGSRCGSGRDLDVDLDGIQMDGELDGILMMI